MEVPGKWLDTEWEEGFAAERGVAQLFTVQGRSWQQSRRRKQKKG